MTHAAKRGGTIRPGQLLAACWNVLNGNVPLLSIEITRDCPLHCSGCYAYGDQHLGTGAPQLRQVSDFRGESLVNGVLDLVRKHKPLHVSLVGGEPMMRHKELTRILPALGDLGVYTLVVTSGVISIPKQWMTIPRLRVAVSVDGLPEHHDIRRWPATYERILGNIRECEVNIHWTITRPMLLRKEYLEEYLAFWSCRDEANRIWISVYSPQVGERSAETLTWDERRTLAGELPRLKKLYPKLLMTPGIAQAFLHPPETPRQCLFSAMSANFTADLKTSVEPCVLGGAPDCVQCGCAASMGFHWVKSVRVAGPLKIGHIAGASLAVGRGIAWFRKRAAAPLRWFTPSPARLGSGQPPAD